MAEWFHRFAQRIAQFTGSGWTFMGALAATLIWLASGPFFGWSVEWNFIANTTTTVITFLMVFLIQNTQNRDALAMQLKLDELIKAVEQADNTVIRAEDETDEELAALKAKYHALSREHAELQTRLGQPQAASG